jgi:hypothetical protein
MGKEMTGGGNEAAVAASDARLRAEYEAGARPVAEIAAEAGMTAARLTALARREGWKLRGTSKSKSTRDTIQRLKALLQQRLAELENQIGSLGEEAKASSSERDIRSMNTLVRTLEKVLELERKDRASRAKRRREQRQFDDAERDALAERLEALHRQWRAEAAEPGAPQGDGLSMELRLAELGERGPDPA